jgi:hypothetical protein
MTPTGVEGVRVAQGLDGRRRNGLEAALERWATRQISVNVCEQYSTSFATPVRER